jgi:hypothetical protein
VQSPQEAPTQNSSPKETLLLSFQEQRFWLKVDASSNMLDYMLNKAPMYMSVMEEKEINCTN